MDQIIKRALDGEVVCSIGQIDNETRRTLDRMVKFGTLTKWRGHFAPVAGAPHGFGPLKTCYGTPETFDAVA
jgi:hypothetical protein